MRAIDASAVPLSGARFTGAVSGCGGDSVIWKEQVSEELPPADAAGHRTSDTSDTSDTSVAPTASTASTAPEDSA
jgi:hypothetical protein